MKFTFCTFAVLTSLYSFCQMRSDYFLVKHAEYGTNKYGWVFVNPRGDTIARLDTAKYYMCFSDTITHFAVVGIWKKPGWWAIDVNKKVLFEIYNTSRGEPSPDELTEGLIRIVDDKKKIGFADGNGKTVIKPQFEFVSPFQKGIAIIGLACKEVLWCCEGDHEDKHYIIQCKSSAVLKRDGKTKAYPNLPPEKLAEKLGWNQDQ